MYNVFLLFLSVGIFFSAGSAGASSFAHLGDGPIPDRNHKLRKEITQDQKDLFESVNFCSTLLEQGIPYQEYELCLDYSYKQYKYDFHVVTGEEEVVPVYRSHGELPLQSGWLIKNNQFAEVFYVDQDLCLRWVVDERAASRHFGYDWNQKIRRYSGIPSGYSFCDHLE